MKWDKKRSSWGLEEKEDKGLRKKGIKYDFFFNRRCSIILKKGRTDDFYYRSGSISGQKKDTTDENSVL